MLHFVFYYNLNVRLQRYLQSNIEHGLEPVVFINRSADCSLWIPDADKVRFEFFDEHIEWLYKLPAWRDYLGLRRVFVKYGCSLVHAHNLWCSYYAYTCGLPMIFGDWEYWLRFPFIFNVQPHIPFHRLLSWFPRFQSKYRTEATVKHLIKNASVIVTNEAVKNAYEDLGAEHILVLPNVPLRLEREYAFAVPVEKDPVRTTAYVGALSQETNFLRNAKGVKRLWDQRRDLGCLYVFEGKRYCNHLDLLRVLRRFHFNLLFWRPIAEHKFYLQNKAFLASVVGVPTIIVSSLVSTIDLLGEFALPVDSLAQIPAVIEGYKPRSYCLDEKHLFEFYEPALYKFYREVASG